MSAEVGLAAGDHPARHEFAPAVGALLGGPLIPRGIAWYQWSCPACEVLWRGSVEAGACFVCERSGVRGVCLAADPVAGVSR